MALRLFVVASVKPIDEIRYSMYTGEAEEGDAGPGQIFAPFLAMEDLLDKLKLLNYEKELVLKMRMRPINRQAAHRLL